MTDNNPKPTYLEALTQRVLVFDGAMGTSIDTFNLAAEIRVPRCIHDVDLHPAPAHGRILGQDRDAPLPLQGIGVHDPFFHLLVGPEGSGLPEHLIHQGGLAVIDVGDDGQVTNQAGLRFPTGVANG